jgi:hypothetical protein
MYGTTKSPKGETPRRYYFCTFYSKTRRSSGVICNNRQYNGRVAEEVVTNGLLYLAEHPEVIDNALKAFALEYEQNDTTVQRRQIEVELKALEGRERAVVEAQVAGIQAGANPAIYSGMFAELAQTRQTLQGQLEVLKREDTPLVIPRDAGSRVAMVIADLATALRSPDLSGAEKHDIFATVIKKIVPQWEGDEEVYVCDVKAFGRLRQTLHTISPV